MSQRILGISRLGSQLVAGYMCELLQYDICRQYYVTAEQRWWPEWVGVNQTDWRHAWLVIGGMTTFNRLSALSLFSLLKHVAWLLLFLKLPSGDHPGSGGRRRVVIEAGAGWHSDARQQSTHLHHARLPTATTPVRRLGCFPAAIQLRSSVRAAATSVVLVYRTPCVVALHHCFAAATGRCRRWWRGLRIIFFTTSTSVICRRQFADFPADSNVANFRCPMCTSAEP